MLMRKKMLVWFTKSSVTQFHSSELFYLKDHILNVSFPQKKNPQKVQTANLLFLRKVVTDKVAPFIRE